VLLAGNVATSSKDSFSMTHRLPSLSVKKILPSGAKTSSHGIFRLFATVSTLTSADAASAWKNRQITAKNKTIIFFNPFYINIGIS
jgi:hypothetical protein